ncbi:phage tail assembly chaperone [Acetobacter sp. DsW_059]|uniref:phage tail assembly chaperone n=1 Tax=Acetobacter sp. DsW_059 TaxID=1670661 RepID=UPI000A3C1777|nr:hypothetical protein [Acetobacter sp. DsW_059]OUJ08383.1 hypothetical protein HK25_13235 [Acetobacter sp. DsW_059]
MEEVEINGRKYTVKKLPAMQQFHVARRLAPILAAFVAGIPSGGEITDSLAGFDLAKIGEEIAALPDKDAEYILNTALSAVTYRDEEAQRDYSIQVRPGVMRYNWIELPEMLRLTVSVIQHNLAGFIPAAASDSKDKAPA